LPNEALLKIRQATHPESIRDEMLDRGLGACWLGQGRIAQIVEQAFFAFDGMRYRLHAWTVMPNHVHVLITVLPDFPLGSIVGSWKWYTARQANKLLGRTGAFWQDDYWDRFIRNDEHFAATVAYIDLNPVKAGLVGAPGLWPWGSARLTT
jgi:putative transposase